MNKNIIIALLITFTQFCYGQDVASLVRKHEDTNYNPKFKGLTDLVVDLESVELKQQLNDQMIFGNIRELKFRVYWTATPERVAVEIIGMPEGFNEIKQQLKQLVLSKFEVVVPLSVEKKFTGYKLSIDNKDGSLVARDDKALNLIPEFRLRFNKDGLLSVIEGKKPVGNMVTTFEWEKTNWSEPRQVNKKSVLKSVDGPQTVTVESLTSWSVYSTVGLPSKLTTTTKQTVAIPGSAPQENTSKEEIQFKNYRVNVGEALKWFLANGAN